MEIDIPFGAKDSELKEWRYTIPEGYTAEIKDGEIIVKSTESEDEKIRKAIDEIMKLIKAWKIAGNYGLTAGDIRRWLEKQKAKERLDRMAPIYNDKESFESALEKAWKYYNESASRKVDSFEDDYIECVFSKGFREGFLYKYKEKQKEQKPAECGKTKINGEPISSENKSVNIPCMEWSKEDEETLEKLHRLLVICRGEKKFIQEADYNKMDNLLKSLRPHWKPSEEQIEALEWMLTTVTIKDGGKGVVLKNLVNDLKNIM